MSAQPMEAPKLKISFVIPAYNERSYISECLASVLKVLPKNSCEAEIIVVNNASTDDTKEIAQLCGRVMVIDEPRKGLARARQTGFRFSTGDLVANIDADTMLPQGWTEKVLDEFRRNTNLVALSGPFIYRDLQLAHRLLVRIFYCLAFGLHVIGHRILKIGAVLQGGNFVVRRTALEKIGGYDVRFTFYGEDTDIARRIQKYGDVKFTFRLSISGSSRRLKREGICTMGFRYAINYFWTIFFRKPYTTIAPDIR
jgi:glycosyltransferase involved in cell wall biosynthesis